MILIVKANRLKKFKIIHSCTNIQEVIDFICKNHLQNIKILRCSQIELCDNSKTTSNVASYRQDMGTCLHWEQVFYKDDLDLPYEKCYDYCNKKMHAIKQKHCTNCPYWEDGLGLLDSLEQ